MGIIFGFLDPESELPVNSEVPDRSASGFADTSEEEPVDLFSSKASVPARLGFGELGLFD